MGMTSLMDLQYDEEIVDRVRQLTPRFAERAAEIDRDARFPTENFAELRDAGLNAVCIPKEWGGGEYPHLQPRPFRARQGLPLHRAVLEHALHLHLPVFRAGER
jgi:alkylation response protein AidB-like acyl-CoA dehydrogenase